VSEAAGGHEEALAAYARLAGVERAARLLDLDPVGLRRLANKQ